MYIHDEDLFLELEQWYLGLVHHNVPKSIGSGTLSVNNNQVNLGNVLFDTGALHRSYINSELVDFNREEWSVNIKPSHSKIRLGDQKTIVESKEEVHGIINFTRSNGELISAPITLVSHNMPGMDVIVGLPDITKSFLPLVIEMIQPIENVNNILSDLHSIDELPLDCNAWSTESIEIGEEEESTVEPSSFAAYLNYMETTYEVALSNYLSDISNHIGPMLQNCQAIKEIMESELARDVFCPKSWDGIKGVPPIDIQFRTDFPAIHKVKSRPINPRMFQNVKKELERLLLYMYEKGDSPWASPLVVAPKATDPYIRMCGDYRWLNLYIDLIQAYIPNVQKEILKASGFKYFLDFDLTNSFHQMRISHDTSLKLALQTPYGQILPKFMPEGVKIASGCLQNIMMEIFAECEEWTIVIFDNLLVLANDEEDCINKMLRILTICKNHGIILKLAKTWLGYEKVKFFGYDIRHNSYEIDISRKEAITKFQMPRNIKEMQRFLGTALFFKSFITNFSDKCHLLHDMTKKTFDWNQSNWKKDYIKAFEDLKEALTNSISIHFPDYNLKWILRVDASDVAVGAVLFQEKELEDKSIQMEVIGVASKKFTDIAFRWDAFKKEGYAAYYGVYFFSYFLRGKPFILETDHRNLLWIEKSDVPIVIRWRVYLQSFTIWIKHIPGTKNVVADFLSRMYLIDNADTVYTHSDNHDCHMALLLNTLIEDDINNINSINTIESDVTGIDDSRKSISHAELIAKVHGGRNLHKGGRRTWQALNKFFPGHKVSFKTVTDYVETCPICQKDRLGMTDTLKPIYRTIKPPHQRSRIGIDRLTITPKDKYGNDTAIVIVEHYTKFVVVYPESEYTGESIAKSLMRFFASYGLFDEIISDPGSDIMSKVVKNLNTWLGIRHIVSLVDWHQSNGVERTNQELLRHLKTLTHDERITNKWSDPMVLSFIIFSINDTINQETGNRAFDLKFGSEDGTYFKLPEGLSVRDKSETWLKLLNEDLRIVREISSKYQQDLIAERLATTPEELQNKFQPTDMVLFQLDPDKPRPSKLSSPYLGPFEVKHQYKNDVEVQHMSIGSIHKFHVTRLKLFIGTREEAKILAQLDGDQFVVKNILQWKGDPKTRSTMSFKVEFEDGDVVWLPFSKDLNDSIPFGDYITRIPMLLPLRYKSTDYNKEIKDWKTKPIEVIIGSIFYMDIRYYTVEWYDTLNIEDKYDKTYVVECRYEKYLNKLKSKVQVRVLIFNEVLQPWSYLFVRLYGGFQHKLLEDMVVVDRAVIGQYPALSPK